MSTYEAEFVWPYPATSVILKGSFDNWTTSFHLTKSGAGFSTKVAVPYDTKIAYKFIVDGKWTVDNTKPTEMDGYNQNNVLKTSPAPPPAPAPSAAPEKTTTKKPEPVAVNDPTPAPAPVEELPKPAVEKKVEVKPAEQKVFNIQPVTEPGAGPTPAVVPGATQASTPPAEVPVPAPAVEEASKEVDIGDEAPKPVESLPPVPQILADKAPAPPTNPLSTFPPAAPLPKPSTIPPASIPLPTTPTKQTPVATSAPATPDARGTINSSAFSTHSDASTSTTSKKKSGFPGGLGSPPSDASPVKSLKDGSKKKRNSFIGRLKRVFSDHHHHKDKE